MSGITGSQWEAFQDAFRAALREVGADLASIDPGGFRLVEPYGIHPQLAYRAFQLGCQAAGIPNPHDTFEGWVASSAKTCDLAPVWFEKYGIEAAA